MITKKTALKTILIGTLAFSYTNKSYGSSNIYQEKPGLMKQAGRLFESEETKRKRLTREAYESKERAGRLSFENEYEQGMRDLAQKRDEARGQIEKDAHEEQIKQRAYRADFKRVSPKALEEDLVLTLELLNKYRRQKEYATWKIADLDNGFETELRKKKEETDELLRRKTLEFANDQETTEEQKKGILWNIEDSLQQFYLVHKEQKEEEQHKLREFERDLSIDIPLLEAYYKKLKGKSEQRTPDSSYIPSPLSSSNSEDSTNGAESRRLSFTPERDVE